MKYKQCFQNQIQGGIQCIFMLAFALQTLPFIFLPSDFGNCVPSKRPYCPLASGHMSKIQVDINSTQ